MDARPQRPIRALRVHGDENIVPVPQGKANTHQRHKSAGALSIMLPVAGLTAAAKRTAFGDVSNTVKSLVQSTDESMAVGKDAHQEMAKSHAISEKGAGILRPAQRPSNTSNINSKATGANKPDTSEPISVTSSNISRAQLAVSREAISLVATNKRTVSKKGTSIYKDAAVEIEALPASQAVSSSTYDQVPLAAANLAIGPRHHKSQPQLKQDQPVLRRTKSKHMGNSADHPVRVSELHETTYQDAREEQHNNDAAGAYGTYPRTLEHKDSAYTNEKDNGTISEKVVQQQDRQLPAPPLVSEPEEYWEEEDEEELYDEQGYTTAHSYPSRGDNTTGGATTVLFPKVTNKVKREIAAAREIVESSRTQDEIDDEAWDTSMVAEYGDEIFSYMRELESKMLPNPHYMDNQAEIQWSMRSVLMDWLIQVHHRFSLLPETLFLCVNYIDRFLSCKVVSLGKLQLVGATAIFVAAKYEEINCPSVGEIVYMVDGGYTVDEILKAERFMLSMLNFELGWPGPMSFLRRISKADDYDLETRTLAKYFLEVTIMDERFVGSPPSYIAAGAHCLSRFMLKKGDWTPAHVFYSEYTWTQLRPLVSMIMECCESPQKHHQAVFEKYADRRYKKASIFVQSEVARGYTLPSPSYPTSRLSLPSTEEVTSNLSFDTRDAFKRMVQVK
ncbi:G2/mitotic-specific cyclin-B [Phlyctema vagabunda]|uniref:G2/mitotic-specific cyclin-B n=1 Tax=Phlyctema vagabunda TaxID=108571 RepID=A0ABR4PJL5_9HELO